MSEDAEAIDCTLKSWKEHIVRKEEITKHPGKIFKII